MITAAPKTGVTIANIRKVSKTAIVTKGMRTRRLRKPGETNVRRVINKFVNEIVVLIPAKTTETSKISCAPYPVNLTLDENGVINVQPLAVSVLLEHLLKYTLRRRALETLSATNQRLSGDKNTSFNIESFSGLKKKSSKPSKLIFFLLRQNKKKDESASE